MKSLIEILGHAREDNIKSTLSPAADPGFNETSLEQYSLLPLVPTTAMLTGPFINTSLDLFPGIGLNAVNAARNESHLAVFVDKLSLSEFPSLDDVRHIGTVCDIKNSFRLGGEATRIAIEGRNRAVIKSITMHRSGEYFLADVDIIVTSDKEYTPDEVAAAYLLKDKYISLVSMTGRDSTYFEKKLKNLNPDDTVDFIASNAPMSNDEFYELMEMTSAFDRVNKLMEHIEIAIRTTQLDIDLETRIAQTFAEEQKARYLKEKKDFINQELNGGDEDLIDSYRTKIDALPISDEYKARLLKEVDRFEITPSGSQEYAVIESYFDCVLDLPWSISTQQDFDINEAKRILDEDHYGLEKVKDRILEYLSVIKLTDSLRSPILCLVGPPGVGKTSIAKSVARATGRKYIRVALGGMHDEAEIRGHRKTYVGAMAGRIISGLRQVQSNDPVFLLDEIDKLAKDYHGDPASALLEALDPEQNSTFTDNYVEIPFDLSKVMFITTANSMGSIPEALLDRLEIIELSGYLPDEKLHIAREHLIPKQMKANGVTDENIIFSDEVIMALSENYTREAGVRQLERCIASLCRKAAKKVVEGEEGPLELTVDKLGDYLGAKVHTYHKAKEEAFTGVVTGLAWTSVGGVTLQIEAVTSNGTGKMNLTGKLGDVMKESAQAAIGYIRSQSERYELKDINWDKTDIHIHIPEGATPKDGPSAGVTMATAVYSSLKKLPVTQKIAMTGEVTLTGRVLAIGGLREKLYAASRAEIFDVIIPKENEEDLKELPKELVDMMNISFAEKVDDVFDFAFGENR